MKQWHSLPIDERDRAGAADMATIAPHGDALYCIVPHVPGRTDRETVVRAGHRAVGDLNRRDGGEPAELCGVHHHEDVEVWQLPYSARPAAKYALSEMRASVGRRMPIVLIRVWQHRNGTCPEGGEGA